MISYVPQSRYESNPGLKECAANTTFFNALVRTSVRRELAVEPDYLSRSDEEYSGRSLYIGTMLCTRTAIGWNDVVRAPGFAVPSRSCTMIPTRMV